MYSLFPNLKTRLSTATWQSQQTYRIGTFCISNPNETLMKNETGLHSM